MGKLRSGRGASLLVALLLFMICSVVGIVVLTAATAVSGRASKLAESDQRYFSVASAAELLAQELNGKSVSIVQEETRVETTVTSYTLVGTPSGDEGSDTTYDDPTCRMTAIGAYPLAPTWTDGIVGSFTFPPDTSDSSVKGDFLTEMALRLLFGKPDLTGKYKYDARYDPTGDPPADSTYAFELSFGGGSATDADSGELSLQLSPPGSLGLTAEALKVEGSYVLRSDGLLTITLSSADGGTDAFTLVLTLQASFRETEDSSTVSEPPTEVWTEAYDEDGGLTQLACTETVVTTTTNTRTSTVTWSLISIGEQSDVTFDGSEGTAAAVMPAGNGGSGDRTL